jgi:hypothetical protein
MVTRLLREKIAIRNAEKFELLKKMNWQYQLLSL